MGNLHPEELQALALEAKVRLNQLSYPNMEILPSDIPGLLHELHVHKIELEMQNDELQKANFTLGESSQRYRALYEFAPIGFLYIGNKDLITECNWKALTMLGIKQQKLIQYRFSQFVDDIDKSLWRNIVLNVNNQVGGEVNSFDIQLIDNDGVNFYANINCLRVNSNAETETLRLAIVDITDRKLAVIKQKANDDKHQEILDSAMEGFWIIDLNGRFLEVNSTYCKMSGYSSSELLTMSISDIEFVESARDTASHVQKVISQGQDRFETKHRRKDGTLFDVKVNSQHMRSEGGRLVVFLQDISSMKAVNDQIELLQLEKQELNGTKQQLQTALDSDRNLSVAVGIVMGQLQIGRDAAMKLLRKRARDQNLKLNELAMILVNAREILNFESRL